MTRYYQSSVIVCLLCAFVHVTHSLTTYNDLKKLGITCRGRDECRGYRDKLPYTKRNCECDSACHTYRDCCVDAQRRTATISATNTMCLNYGEDYHSGVYVVSKCSSSWTGPKEVKENCEGSLDLRDPVSVAPVTSVSGAATYKNLYCAQCNDANMNTLKFFHFNVSCENLEDFPQDKIMDQITYNEEENKWGINRLDAEGKQDFAECTIIFEVPDYLERSVRFCRANVISKCARDWTRQKVKMACEEYMAVVYSKTHAYRNPHCAVCNHVTIPQLTCTPDGFKRKRPFALSALININDSDGNTPSCPANNIYDPYFKRCRPLSCARPEYVVKDGKCVPGG